MSRTFARIVGTAPEGPGRRVDRTRDPSVVLDALTHGGVTVDTGTARDRASIEALLSGKRTLYLPASKPLLGPTSRELLVDFAMGGGTIVLIGGHIHLGWVNTTFRLSLAYSTRFHRQLPMPKNRETMVGPFARGPLSVPGNPTGFLLSAASMPLGGQVVYEGELGDRDASVALIPAGGGRLIYLGWEWHHDGAQKGSEGEWWTVLRLASAF